MRLPVLLSGEVLLAALLLFSGPASAEGTKPVSVTTASRHPSLVLITAEGLRPDRLGCYKEKEAIPTPAIDGLAADGIVFEHVVAPSPSSLPSLATLLTGRYPFHHGVWEDAFRTRLSAKVPTLAERLRGSGYRTAAFVATSRLEAARGFSRGFESYDDGYHRDPNGAWRLVRRWARSLVPETKPWLESVGASPFFLWVHFVEAGIPGATRVEEPARDAPKAYAERITELDGQIGELLQFLKDRGLYERTVVVLTADHGEGLGDHDELFSGVYLYETTLRVPLLLKAASGDGAKQGRVESLSGLVDVYPTLEHLLGMARKPGLPGRDLLSPVSPARPAYYAAALMGKEIFGWAPLELVAQENLRLITGGGTELYDLGSDRSQERDLSRSRRADVLRLKKVGLGITGGASLPPSRFRPGATIPPGLADRIVKLGYAAPSSAGNRSQPPPDQTKHGKTLPLLEAIHLEVELSGFRALERAENSLLGAAPASPFTLLNAAQLNIGRSLSDPGALDRAATQLKALQKLYPRDPEVYHILGHLAVARGKPADAETFLKLSRILGPSHPGEVAYDLACTYARQGKGREAVSELRRGLSLGYRDRDHISADPDLDSLRTDPAYLRLMQEEFPSPSGS